MGKISAKGFTVPKLTCIVLIFLLALTTFAAAEELGSAPDSGEGGGKAVAFSLVETKPKNGGKDVGVDTGIWLLFNKNVVNMTVSDNNKANILLRDLDGHLISTEVTMRDDQIEPLFRREIIVAPKAPLEAGTTYILTVGKNVMAKNGSSLGKDYTITFTTSDHKTQGGHSLDLPASVQPAANTGEQSAGNIGAAQNVQSKGSAALISNDGTDGIDSVSGAAMEKNSSAEGNDDRPLLTESDPSAKEGTPRYGMIASSILIVVAGALLLFRTFKKRRT